MIHTVGADQKIDLGWKICARWNVVDLIFGAPRGLVSAHSIAFGSKRGSSRRRLTSAMSIGPPQMGANNVHPFQLGGPAVYKSQYNLALEEMQE